MSNKFKRIVDLFSEGETCFLGDDETAKPICVWVNKLNSLEEEEARLDGQSARTEKMVAVADLNHPETQSMYMTLEEWTDEELFQAAANQKGDMMVALAVADVEADEEWKDKVEYLRRQPQILDDAKVAADDPRREQLVETNSKYIAAIEAAYEKRMAEVLEEVKAEGKEKVRDQFIKDYKDRLAIDHYMQERRITQLYFAVRECEAVRAEEGEWEHKTCDHAKKLMDSRHDVRDLPQHVLDRMLDTYESVQIGSKNVGNFQETQSS